MAISKQFLCNLKGKKIKHMLQSINIMLSVGCNKQLFKKTKTNSFKTKFIWYFVCYHKISNKLFYTYHLHSFVYFNFSKTLYNFRIMCNYINEIESSKTVFRLYMLPMNWTAQSVVEFRWIFQIRQNFSAVQSLIHRCVKRNIYYHYILINGKSQSQCKKQASRKALTFYYSLSE